MKTSWPQALSRSWAAAPDPVGMGREEVEEAELGGPETDLGAVGQDAAALAIDEEVAGLDPIRAGVRRPAEQGPDAGPELARGEGLHHVVVRARVEAPDPVRLLRPGGDEDDGHFALGGGALAAQAAEELVAARPRQHPVEEHEVHPRGPERLPGARHVLGLADLVSRFPEVPGHHLPHGRLVFHDQQTRTHVGVLLLARVGRGGRLASLPEAGAQTSLCACSSLCSRLVCRMSLPLTRNTMYSPMFFAWSPIRSSARAHQIMSSTSEMRRGSSIM